MGFLDSTKVQNNQPHPLPHLSLLPSLFIWLLTTICPQWSSKTPSSERLPTRNNQLSYQGCFEQKQHQHSNPASTVPRKDIVILPPYLGLQSNQVAKRLKSCEYNFYSCVNLKIIFQNTRCIKSFFPYKDRINRSHQSRIIYRANCWDCNGFYIGKTKRRLHDRKTEHFKALAKNGSTSSIADHVKTTGHNIKWDDFDILAKGKTDYHWKIRDLIYSRTRASFQSQRRKWKADALLTYSRFIFDSLVFA